MRNAGHIYESTPLVIYRNGVYQGITLCVLEEMSDLETSLALSPDGTRFARSGGTLFWLEIVVLYGAPPYERKTKRNTCQIDKSTPFISHLHGVYQGITLCVLEEMSDLETSLALSPDGMRFVSGGGTLF